MLCDDPDGERGGGWVNPQPGTEPEPPGFEGEVLTPGPPGKPLRVYILKRGHR